MSQTTTGTRSISPKLIVAGVVAVLALIFVFQNTGSRRIHFLFWSLSMPQWIWLLVIFVAGAVVGSIFPWLRPRKKD
jgi:uncharacterized integral membrane protein